MTENEHTDGIEVRILSTRFDEIREAASFPTLGEAFAGIEKLLDEVMDADGHEPRSPLLRNVSWIGAPRENYVVRVFVGGEEWQLDDLVCTAEECGAELDSRPGWSFTGEHADFEMRCPRHTAAERKVA